MVRGVTGAIQKICALQSVKEYRSLEIVIADNGRVPAGFKLIDTSKQ